MKKSEGFVFFTILVILLMVSIILSTNFSLAQTVDIPAQDKIEQAYSWLEYKVGNWQSLTTQDHALAILALQCRGSGQAGITRLKAVSFENTNFRCWGIGPTRPTNINSCHLLSTAFARLALSNENLTKVDNWILNQSKFFSELYWFIQLDTNRGAEMNCKIDYDGGSANVSVSEDKRVTILSQTGNCFSATNPNYWLALSRTCYQRETEFKIKCDINNTSLDYTASLLYRKDSNVQSQNSWYVGPDSEKAKSGETTALTTKAYCLKDSTGNCNYEATVWSAYALKEAENERYKEFIPYIVIMSTETANLKYFPQAFLYLITNSVEAGQSVATMQEPSGFWCAISKLITGTSCSNTPYGQFYDTALAGLTEQGNLGTEKNGARYYLTNFSEGKTFLKTRISGKDYMYWKCNEHSTIDQCKDVRDTAFLLWSLWGKLLCAGTGEEDNCLNHDGICKTACESGEEDVNFTCGSSEEVCCVSSISEGNCEINDGICKATCDNSEAELTQMACSGMNVCCKPYTDSYCISDLGGDLCEYDETCIGSQLDSVDNIGGRQCCSGSCTLGNTGDKTCSELSGYPCDADQICLNEDTWDNIPFIATSDESRCCFDGAGIAVCVQNKECSDIGKVCDSGQECSIATERTTNEKECCSGTCLSSCSDIGGEQCGTKETCSTGSFSQNSVEGRCCIGTCKESANLTWLWILLIILLLLGGGFALYWFKFRKKGEKKEEKTSPFGGMFPSRPQTIPAQQSRTFIQPGLAPRPSTQTSQYPRTMTQKFDVTLKSPSNVKTTVKKTKTEVELEKTLSKLKRMTKTTKKK